MYGENAFRIFDPAVLDIKTVEVKKEGCTVYCMVYRFIV